MKPKVEKKDTIDPPPLASEAGNGEGEAIRHLKGQIALGKHWFIALLEAIKLWDRKEEVIDGRHYRYLIAHEAFDWLLLAERLITEIDGFMPEEEKINLLFFGRPPIDLSPHEFRERIGYLKYRAYLNYYYGVMVEEALQWAIEEEMAREQRATAFDDEYRVADLYQRIYGQTQAQLLRQFREESGYAPGDIISITELKEFTYWLFKYRVKFSEKPRLASDTKRGLQELHRLRSKGRTAHRSPTPSPLGDDMDGRSLEAGGDETSLPKPQLRGR
ncbi:MAG: hypothetical protein HYX88_02780 [Chloroflexi bacterium]|nr:hypothetical protein [Chloroflexota bacterium]